MTHIRCNSLTVKIWNRVFKELHQIPIADKEVRFLPLPYSAFSTPVLSGSSPSGFSLSHSMDLGGAPWAVSIQQWIWPLSVNFRAPVFTPAFSSPRWVWRTSLLISPAACPRPSLFVYGQCLSILFNILVKPTNSFMASQYFSISWIPKTYLIYSVYFTIIF